MFDVVIIGAGIIGSSIAQSLSRFSLNVLVMEAHEEISSETSKANSGISHAGFDAEPGTLKARFNVLGNSMYKKLTKELDIPYEQNGSLVLCFQEEDMPRLQLLYDQGIKNGVPDLRILEKDEVLKLEPNVSENIYRALYAPTGGIISPYEATIAFAENAFINGVNFKLNCRVQSITKKEDHYIINTSGESVLARFIVNAAGLYSDEINNLISEKKYSIIPRRGEYILTDKMEEGFLSKTLFQLPTKLGKGVLVTPTMHGGLLIGPSSEDILDKGDFDTTSDVIKKVIETASMSVKSLPVSSTITSFAGLRANLSNFDDFIVEKLDGENFINAVGINSPGLTSAPAIAEYISNIIADVLDPKEKLYFNPYRVSIKRFNELSLKEQNELIKENSAYGQIVCRCETVTEAQVVDAIRRQPGATTLDGIKRRVRCGMGRCQGGFCTSKVMEIMCRELGKSPFDVTKFGEGSNLIVNHIKDDL
ncbi:MAG: NAD(P)/FAD-dependent oxidoreductase [Oscillospiraceae bacterium]|nr:NAD(P)/FAD-dependent oxidoreductase [Oscillospiraceae bacterium]